MTTPPASTGHSGDPSPGRWLALRQIALVARDRDSVVDVLRAVFGLEVCHVDPAVAQFGLHNALLPVGSQFLEVVAPVRDGTTAGRYLDRRGGDGGYMVITQCNDHAARRRRVEQLGVRIAADLTTDGFTNMQLHPADTGGSFLEIDQQAGDDPGGMWLPAGDRWEPAVHTDVIAAITAAELQCDDPSSVCRRWADITEIESHRDGTAWTLPLANASVRFVPVSDGRGEGLGGVDLAVVDAESLRAAAAQRGVPARDDLVLAGGMRFNLIDPADTPHG